MNDQFYCDRLERPELFHFSGAIPPDRLNRWMQERGLDVPNDLKQFWSETGGGDLFESETILGPFGQVELGDDVDSVNEFHKRKGLPSDYLIFHTGMALSIVRLSTGEYATVEEGSYMLQQTFKSLDDWYRCLIRKEYASRYEIE